MNEEVRSAVGIEALVPRGKRHFVEASESYKEASVILGDLIPIGRLSQETQPGQGLECLRRKIALETKCLPAGFVWLRECRTLAPQTQNLPR